MNVSITRRCEERYAEHLKHWAAYEDAEQAARETEEKLDRQANIAWIVLSLLGYCWLFITYVL